MHDSPAGSSQPLRRQILLGLVILLAVSAATYRHGADSYVRINDFLDALLPSTRLLVHEPLLGGLEDRIEEPLGGLQRNCFRTTLNLGVLPHYVLPPVWAVAWNEAVGRIVAFLGMLLLLRRRLLPDGPSLAVFGAALCFALLPVFPAAHLSVAAQPLLLLALLEIREGRGGPCSWGIVALFPLYSTLAYIGPYVLLGVGLLAAWDLVHRRRIPWGLGAAAALMAVLYAASEYRLLYQTFFTDFESYRVEWEHRSRPLLIALFNAMNTILFSQHHAAAGQFPVILGTTLGVLAWQVVRRRSLRVPLDALRRGAPPALAGLVWTLLLCGLAGLVVGLYQWTAIQEGIRSTGVSAVRMFGFHRVQWFHPLLFGLAFAFALAILARSGRPGRVLAGTLLVAQVGVALWSGDAPRVAREDGVTFREFYSPALFEEVRSAIGRPPAEYRVATFGLIPGIALFNGFRTVGGFLSNYPLEYKHRFRPVIAGELARDPWLRGVYDDWGAHVHIYSTELGMIIGYRRKALYTRHQPVQAVERVEIGMDALADLGAEYILSAVDIGNRAELGLRLDRVFEREDSPWRIRLYRLPGTPRAAAEGRP